MIVFSFDELGIAARKAQLIRDMVSVPSGCVVFAGYFGSGKTTTMYSVASEVANSGRPIHILVPEGEDARFLTTDILNEWKTTIYADTDEEFDKAIAVAVGQNSLIVLCGTDDRVINNAFKCANQGELVFVELHTPFAGIDVVYSLRQHRLPNEPIINNLIGVVSQLLFSGLCKDCAREESADVTTTRLIYPGADEARQLWTEVGCETCEKTGLQGRVAANETLRITEDERPRIREYIESNTYPSFSPSVYQSIFEDVRSLVEAGSIGIGTYKQEVLSSPLFRGHHLMEAEQARSAEINDMFSRFVTKEVVERLMTERNLESLLKGEKRKVTCMFLDIRGSSKLAEQMPPDLLFDLLNTYFSRLIDVVFKYEGTIEKFTGDGLLILFGAPLKQGDQETRAVACAIEIQRVILHLNQHEDYDHEIKMGIGINTGVVVAGCIGNKNRMVYTALGDAVNAAARLEGQASADQILVGSETNDAITQTYQTRSLGMLELRGKDFPLECFEIIWGKR